MEIFDPDKYDDPLEQAMHNLKWCKNMNFVHEVDEAEIEKKAADELRAELKKLGYRVERISWEGLTRENT